MPSPWYWLLLDKVFLFAIEHHRSSEETSVKLIKQCIEGKNIPYYNLPCCHITFESLFVFCLLLSDSIQQEYVRWHLSVRVPFLWGICGDICCGVRR